MKTNPRRLLGSALVALTALAVANWLLAHSMRNAVPHRLRQALVSRKEVRTVALGNSSIAAGFDSKAFNEAWPAAAPAMNAGLGAAGVAQWYVAWRITSDEREDIRHVIIGAFDHLLTSQTLPSWNTWHSNESFAFFSDASLAEPYGTSNRADRLIYRTCRLIPMFTERGGLWTKAEKIRRSLGSWGMPLDQEGTNAFGRVKDSALLLVQDAKLMRLESQRAVEAGTPLSPPVRDILTESQRKGIHAVLVMMPLAPARHSLYTTPEWQRYVAHVSSLAAQQGGLLVCATDWITDASMFDDQVHMNSHGAAFFSRRLAQELAATPPPQR